MLFTDQLNQTIELSHFPKRIVSLVPSQSELLWDLGLKSELVGITRFCIHPPQLYQSVQRVGGTKTLHLDEIRKLQPDLIIGNKEENEYSQIEELRKEFNVWMSDIYTLEDALDMLQKVGELVDRRKAAVALAESINSSFHHLRQHGRRVLYLIWKPYMAAGKATFIGNMLRRMGLVNLLQDESARYPSLTEDELVRLNPETILLSSEPFPFKEKHVRELKSILPNSNIILVDGELFSWYGSRLQKSADYFNSLKL